MEHGHAFAYRKAPGSNAEPNAVTTRTSAFPAAPAGVTTFRVVLPDDVMAAAFGPKYTVAPVNPVPVIVTGVPPATGPEAGLIEVIDGGRLFETTSPLVNPATDCQMPSSSP